MNYTDIECSHYRKIAIRLALVCLCVETSFIIFLLYCEQLLCPFGELAVFLDHESVSAHRRVTKFLHDSRPNQKLRHGGPGQPEVGLEYPGPISVAIGGPRAK